MNRHTDTQYESELATLASHVNLMSARAEGMVSNSVRALFTRDAALARSVVEQDADLDRLEKESDRRCLNILARRSPVGEDLRFVTAVFKVVTDLERIGDLAVNIAERGLDLAGTVGIDVGPEVEALAAKVTVQLAEAVRAFAERDAVKADEVIAMDDDADERYHQIVRALAARIREDPGQVEQDVALQSAAKQLERIGDHATNLAEQVILLVRGQDLRHQGKVA